MLVSVFIVVGVHLPTNQISSVNLGALESDVSTPTHSKSILKATIYSNNLFHSFPALFDLGAVGTFIVQSLVKNLGIELQPLSVPFRLNALNSQPLFQITHQTATVQLQVSRNHCETVSLFIFVSPSSPVILRVVTAILSVSAQLLLLSVVHDWKPLVK